MANLGQALLQAIQATRTGESVNRVSGPAGSFRQFQNAAGTEAERKKTLEDFAVYRYQEKESLAEEQMQKEKQADLKERLQKKHAKKLSGGSRLETKPLEPERLVPEKMVPENMDSQRMIPQNPIPEGESSVPPMKKPPEPVSVTMQYLTHICNKGIRGAMITQEILGEPLSRRSGYFARNRRKLR